MAIKIQTMIAQHENEFLRDLRKMIQIPSVKGPAKEAMPFGEGPRQALNLALKFGQQYGFKTGMVDDAAAYVQWGNDDQNYVGIFGHLDVVPAGSHWSVPPFDLTKKNSRLYGRGILDNKGPSMASLFGMKLLKDMGIQLPYTIRLVFGSDEESGSADMRRYLANEAAPTLGFTPDGKYPAVYGERGIVNFIVRTPIPANQLSRFEILNPEEQSSDHVPDSVIASVGDQVIHAHGKRSPSNAPDLGCNALTILAQEIDTRQVLSDEIGVYFHWLANLYDDHYGKQLGIDFADVDSGKLIMTPYQLQKAGNNLELAIAVRYPVSVTEEQVISNVKQHLITQSKLKIVRSIPSVMHDKTSWWIRKLSQAYEQVTGLDGTPVTTTGATYARVVPNIIAFGPSFPGQKGIAHKQDEYMDEKDLLMNMEIDMRAMIALGQRKDDD